MHIFIDDGNIGTDLSHFLLGLCEIRVQGSEARFQVLAMGMGDDDEGTRKGLGGHGYQWYFHGTFRSLPELQIKI
jgi:hypothetical protein